MNNEIYSFSKEEVINQMFKLSSDVFSNSILPYNEKILVPLYDMYRKGKLTIENIEKEIDAINNKQSYLSASQRLAMIALHNVALEQLKLKQINQLNKDEHDKNQNLINNE